MNSSVLQLQVQDLLDRVHKLSLLLSGATLTAKEVAARYRWSEATLYRRKRAGQLPPPARFPGNVWRLADLVAAEADGTLPGPSQ
ncbi:MAG TPA: hypothetical protein PKA41_11070 [Verrucomicrobiota bacterium]|nr:hypothetical protein [Verrucomicrobiota bacterium]